MRKRALDAGGSQTRIAKSAMDKTCIPSPCMEIPADAAVKGHIIKDRLTDFVIKKSPCASLNGRRFVRGDAMNQYSGNMLICNNEDVKVLQEITYINLLYAIASDCYNRGINDDDFQVIVCIPAAEFYDDRNDRIDEVKTNLAGTTSIYFPMLDTSVRFTIDRLNIGVVAEGVVAAYKYKNDRNFVFKNTIIFDVGYRSTDVTVLLKFEPVGEGAASRPVGGINLEANIQSKMERDNLFVSTKVIQEALSTIYVIDKDATELTDITDYIHRAKEEGVKDYIGRALDLMRTDGIMVSRAQIEQAVRSHYILHGSEIVDITDYVHEAKIVFADLLHRIALDVTNAKMMNIGDISNTLCVGRPFSGDLDDPYNLVNLLRDKFHGDVCMYAVPDAGTANVVEMIQLLGSDSE